MSLPDSSMAAAAIQSGRRIGHKPIAASADKARSVAGASGASSMARSAANRGASHTKSALRGESKGAAAKPAGGRSRKARLARVNARTVALP